MYVCGTRRTPGAAPGPGEAPGPWRIGEDHSVEEPDHRSGFLERGAAIARPDAIQSPVHAAVAPHQGHEERIVHMLDALDEL